MNFLQSQQWFDTKTDLGNKCFPIGHYFFQTTKLPLVNKYIGYMPRVDLTKIDYTSLVKSAKEAKCVFITIDPENLKTEIDSRQYLKGKVSNIAEGLPIHLPNTVYLNLEKSEDELLANMKQKSRYNLKLAQKKGVKVSISNKDSELDLFIDLYLKTLKRQKYAGRSEHYLKTVWKHFRDKVFIANAYYEEVPLASWFVIAYDNTLTYVYGGSSEEHKNLMAPYALVWELIKYGKQNGYKILDLFGIKQDLSDGYSRFKAGFGGELIEFADTVDVVIDTRLYGLIKLVYKIRNKLRF